MIQKRPGTRCFQHRPGLTTSTCLEAKMANCTKPPKSKLSQSSKTASLLERLTAKICINTKTGCWEWTASKHRDGYGQIWVNGTMRKAHRASYELHFGPIQDGMNICHRCDNRACINPDHLFSGAPADNSSDMTAKGRQARGINHPRAKLSEADVIAIRAAVGVTQQDLAAQYGVYQQLISYIRSGKGWSHI